MEDDNMNIILFAGLGFLFYQQKQNNQGNQNNNNGPQYNPNAITNSLPPEPPTQGGTSPEWMEWVALAVSTYGVVTELWEPGGPFYGSGLNVDEVEDIYDDVYSDPYGWNGTGLGRKRFKGNRYGKLSI